LRHALRLSFRAGRAFRARGGRGGHRCGARPQAGCVQRLAFERWIFRPRIHPHARFARRSPPARWDRGATSSRAERSAQPCGGFPSGEPPAACAAGVHRKKNCGMGGRACSTSRRKRRGIGAGGFFAEAAPPGPLPAANGLCGGSLGQY
jgi:hypothetical protein